MPSLNIIGNVNLTGGKYNRTPFVATGGVIQTFVSGGVNYTSHTFISGSGTFEILTGETSAQVLVVGAGGSGAAGGPPNAAGYGGGGGGLVYTGSFFLRKNPQPGPSTFTAVVAPQNDGFTNTGATSSFTSTYGYEQIVPIIAYGGGNGGYNGASGGGNASAIYGDQGNNGGVGNVSGGGGANQAGSVRNGGNGKGFTLQDGTTKYYAGGGGGGGYSNTSTGPGTGGQGGGGNGSGTVATPGIAGTANTGGGGGGGNTANDAADRSGGGQGGSGVVIICYPTLGA